jgi:hypothetical protein
VTAQGSRNVEMKKRHNLYSLSDTVKQIIKSRRLRFIGNVARMIDTGMDDMEKRKFLILPELDI